MGLRSIISKTFLLIIVAPIQIVLTAMASVLNLTAGIVCGLLGAVVSVASADGGDALFRMATKFFGQAAKTWSDQYGKFKETWKLTAAQSDMQTAKDQKNTQKTREDLSKIQKEASESSKKHAHKASEQLAVAAQNSKEITGAIRKQSESDKKVAHETATQDEIHKRTEKTKKDIEKNAKKLSQAVYQTEKKEIRQTRRAKTQEEKLSIKKREKEKRIVIKESVKNLQSSLKEIDNQLHGLGLDITTIENERNKQINTYLQEITGLKEEQINLRKEQVELKEKETTQQSETNDLITQFIQLETKQQKGKEITEFKIQNEYVTREAFENNLLNKREEINQHITNEMAALSHSTASLMKTDLSTKTENEKTQNNTKININLMKITQLKEQQKQINTFCKHKQQEARVTTAVEKHKAKENLRDAKETAKQQKETATSQTDRNISKGERKQVQQRLRYAQETQQNKEARTQCLEKINNLKIEIASTDQKAKLASTLSTMTVNELEKITKNLEKDPDLRTKISDLSKATSDHEKNKLVNKIKQRLDSTTSEDKNKKPPATSP